MPIRIFSFGIVLFWAACFTAGCLKPDLQQLEFFTVETKPAVFQELDSFQAHGLIGGLLKTEVDECGFIWSDDPGMLSGPNPTGTIAVVAAPARNGPFQATLPTQQGGTIYFRAYAFQGERQLYAQGIQSFSLGAIVELAGKAEVDNNSARVPGILVGLEKYGVKVQAYGHVFSPTDKHPALGNAKCDTVDLGSGNDDGVFFSQIDSLEFNMTYYVRAYVVSDNKAFYSSTADSFRISDGWEQIGYFATTYKAGLMLADEERNRAFAGFGCKMESDCSQNDLSAECWLFDPSNALDQEPWEPTTPLAPDVTKRTNASGFILNDTLYVLFGDTGGGFLTLSFRKYDLVHQNWLPYPQQPPVAMTARTGAVAFILKGKGYIGTGKNLQDPLPPEYLSDFWEYNPATGSWRQVASIPALGPAGTPNNGGGREEAAALAFNNSTVVGGGTRGVLYLRDFWRFTPPAPSNPQDTGSWTLLPALFPGPGRTQAVAFSIGDLGYYGTGYNDDPEIGLLDDWWAFDNGTGAWEPRSRFRGPRRRDAMGFALQEKGYLFCGIGILILNNGNVVTSDVMADGWRYVPVKK
ncbi:MAG: hypothetical protein H6569_10980 [Lewinellaceae bacterium]|nr:hypothetical protein [Lewinellaceae bacterium]